MSSSEGVKAEASLMLVHIAVAIPSWLDQAVSKGRFFTFFALLSIFAAKSNGYIFILNSTQRVTTSFPVSALCRSSKAAGFLLQVFQGSLSSHGFTPIKVWTSSLPAFFFLHWRSLKHASTLFFSSIKMVYLKIVVHINETLDFHDVFPMSDS